MPIGLRAFNELMACAALTIQPEGTVKITGKDPVLDTPFLAGEAVASAVAAQAATVTKIWEMKTGRRQQINVDVKAAVNSITGLNNVHQSGHPVEVGFLNESTIGFYPTLDGKWIFILGLFPSLRDGLLNLLSCPNNRTAIGEAIAKWNGQELEDVMAEHDLCGAMLRSQEEWRSHPQGKALLRLPVVDIIKIGESDPEGFKGVVGTNDKKNEKSIRPLSGIRVIDMIRKMKKALGLCLELE